MKGNNRFIKKSIFRQKSTFRQNKNPAFQKNTRFWERWVRCKNNLNLSIYNEFILNVLNNLTYFVDFYVKKN